MHKVELGDAYSSFRFEDYCICSIYGVPLDMEKKTPNI